MFDNNGKWNKEFVPNQWENVETSIIKDEFNSVMNQCVSELPSKWMECILMKFYEEKNSNEICQELNISDTNLWQIVHRAKLKLRSCLEFNWFTK